MTVAPDVSWSVNTRGFVGPDVRWSVKTRGFAVPDVRWSVKTRGFVDLSDKGSGRPNPFSLHAARTNFYLDSADQETRAAGKG